MKRLLVRGGGALALAAGAAAAAPGAVTDASWANRAYAQAVQLLHDGRPAEAYGRIMGLANAGHPDSARLALTMCRHGLRLYGRDWDCAPFEMEAWARHAGLPPPGPLQGAGLAPAVPANVATVCRARRSLKEMWLRHFP